MSNNKTPSEKWFYDSFPASILDTTCSQLIVHKLYAFIRFDTKYRIENNKLSVISMQDLVLKHRKKGESKLLRFNHFKEISIKLKFCFSLF